LGPYVPLGIKRMLKLKQRFPLPQVNTL